MKQSTADSEEGLYFLLTGVYSSLAAREAEHPSLASELSVRSTWNAGSPRPRGLESIWHHLLAKGVSAGSWLLNFAICLEKADKSEKKLIKLSPPGNV